MNIKKIVAGVLACCVVGEMGVIPKCISPVVSITASAQTEKSGTYGDNITWTMDNSGTLTISGTGDIMNNDSTIRESERTALKKVIIENGVTGIGNSLFMGCVNLESVTLPDSLTNIGKDSFSYCKSLKSITIPDSVTSIGYSAFSNCTDLTSITIPNSVTDMGMDLFKKCTALTSVTIPESITTIRLGTFSNCESLTSVTIPDSVTKIYPNAFYDCKNLSSITIPESVTDIGISAFEGTAWLENKLAENPFVIVNDILIASAIRLGDITIPDNIKNIGSGVFYGCSGITSVTIPDNIISIGNTSFYRCIGLTEITIPDSVTSIGNMTFGYCTGLETVTLPDSVKSIGNGAFDHCENLSEITILNPECEINDNEYTISNGNDKNYNCYFDGTIYGYANSTAQAYAEKYDYKFEPLGDANGDGKVTIADSVILQKYLLGTGSLSGWKSADLCKDDRIDVFDLCLLKQMLIQKK